MFVKNVDGNADQAEEDAADLKMEHQFRAAFQIQNIGEKKVETPVASAQPAGGTEHRHEKAQWQHG